MTKESHAHSRSDPPGAQRRDPVCGRVVEEDAKHRHEHAGEIHRFCSSGCREKFAADPTRYPEPREPAGVEVSEGTVYTCPMHPEVEQVGLYGVRVRWTDGHNTGIYTWERIRELSPL